MTGVSFGLSDFVTGGPILELPVREGASWAVQLNRADALSCTIDMNDPDALALDLRSSSEPKKTVLTARTDDDKILAWGLISKRKWNEDERTLTLDAGGVLSTFFGSTLIAPALALTAPLKTNDAEGYPIVNPALSVAYTGLSYGTIGKRLVEQRLAFPGAPTVFDLPADELGTRERTDWLFSGMKTIGSALSDLTDVVNGPDFAFDAQRASNGLGLRYVMRHGSEANPRIGAPAGTWSLGGESPITGFEVSDDGSDLATAAWLTAGRQSGSALISRTLNSALTAAGYPPLDVVDTSHSDVSVQATLDSYGAELIQYAAKPKRELSFSVRGDATPELGAYRPGDTVNLDVPDDHPYLTPGVSIPIRITSISGDETGLSVKIGCVIVDA